MSYLHKNTTESQKKKKTLLKNCTHAPVCKLLFQSFIFSCELDIIVNVLFCSIVIYFILFPHGVPRM